MKYNLDLAPEERETALATLRPTGYRILVAIAKVEDKVGSIFIPDGRKSDEEVAAILGKVVALGGDAYKDTARFSEAYCKADDVVLMASYTGRRFKIKDREYRLINDDSVMAVVKNPDAIDRAGVA